MTITIIFLAAPQEISTPLQELTLTQHLDCAKRPAKHVVSSEKSWENVSNENQQSHIDNCHETIIEEITEEEITVSISFSRFTFLTPHTNM